VILVVRNDAKAMDQGGGSDEDVGVADRLSSLLQRGIDFGSPDHDLLCQRQDPAVRRLPETLRADPEQLSLLPVTNASGEVMPLSELARVRFDLGPGTCAP